MRRFSLLLAIPVIMWMSCNRDSILGTTPDPLLVKTIMKDSLGRTSVVTYYNQFGIIADTGYSTTNGAVMSAHRFDYNSKGKRTYYHWYLPFFYTAGNHWAGKYFYDSDTILRISEAYTNDKLSTRTYRYYDNTGQPSVDSVVYFGLNPGMMLIRYRYDAQRRASGVVSLNSQGDSTRIITYQYTTNTVEEQTVYIDLAYNSRQTSRKITQYLDDGKILSEKGINESGQVTNEINYTYDAGGRLTNKKTISGSSIQEHTYTYDANGWLIKELDSNSSFPSFKTELIYTNNSTGKPEKVEKYSNDKLHSTTFYYYQ